MIIYNLIKKTVLFFSLKYHKVNYYNTENIPINQNCLICCNHRSNWDPILISKPINKKIFFMAKQELFKKPVFGLILKKLGAFPVKRGLKDISAINHAIDLLHNNNFVVIFPEGTRSKTANFLKPKVGASVISHKANANILPIRIIYHEPIKFKSHIDIIYGNIITPEELNISNESFNNDIKSASLMIMEHIKSLNIDNPHQ